jgi:hypothetical protein
MANGNGAATKSDLQDQLDEIERILSDAYQPESSREDLASAVGAALSVIEGDGDDEDDSDDDGD